MTMSNNNINKADLGNWANKLQMLFLDALRTFKVSV